MFQPKDVFWLPSRLKEADRAVTELAKKCVSLSYFGLPWCNVKVFADRVVDELKTKKVHCIELDGQSPFGDVLRNLLDGLKETGIELADYDIGAADRPEDEVRCILRLLTQILKDGKRTKKIIFVWRELDNLAPDDLRRLDSRIFDEPEVYNISSLVLSSKIIRSFLETRYPFVVGQEARSLKPYSREEIISFLRQNGKGKNADMLWERTKGIPELLYLQLTTAEEENPVDEDLCCQRVKEALEGMRTRRKDRSLWDVLHDLICNGTGAWDQKDTDNRQLMLYGLAEESLPQCLVDYVRDIDSNSEMANIGAQTKRERNGESRLPPGKVTEHLLRPHPDCADRKQCIVVDIDRHCVEVLPSTGSGDSESVNLDGVLLLITVLAFNGFGKNRSPKEWLSRIKKISEVFNGTSANFNKELFAWCKVKSELFQMSDKLRDIRNRLEVVLSRLCNKTCHVVPKSPKGRKPLGREPLKQMELANWDSFFRVSWICEGSKYNNFPLDKLPKELAELLVP